MMRKPLRWIVAGCALGLLPASAHAQVDEPQQAGQARPQATQVVPPGAENRQQTPDQQEGEQYEARRVAPSARINLSSATTVQDFLTSKLMLGNHAEIELSQIALERAQHEDVKRFAQKMIQEHSQMNQKLMQTKGAEGNRAATTAGATDRGTVDRQTTEPGERQAADRQATDRQPAATAQTQRPALQGQQGQQVPQQLAQFTQQACETHLEMNKQLLQKQQGQDFDMGYIGLQIALHTSMLAELQAMQSQDLGAPELQQLVSQATQATEQHLQEAQQLAQRLEDDRSPANNAGSQSRTNEARGAQSGAQPAQGNQQNQRGAQQNRGSN